MPKHESLRPWHGALVGGICDKHRAICSQAKYLHLDGALVCILALRGNIGALIIRTGFLRVPFIIMGIVCPKTLF